MSSGRTNSTVFFGTGPVAAASLELLVKHTEIEAVVTKPNPAHHKHKAPVIELANKLDLPLVTAGSKSELDQVVAEANFKSVYAVLIDFGIIVSQRVIDAFEHGIINSHFSLLPLLRGADPISFSILDGSSETGVSLMLIDEGMDTGQLLAQRSLLLTGDETTPSLTDQLVQLSDELLQEHVSPYLSGKLKPYPQPENIEPGYSRKLTKQDSQLDWAKPAAELEREVRAFLGWPGSKTTLGNLAVTVTKSSVGEPTTAEPGTISAAGKSLSIATSDNWLVVEALKPAGKKEMPIQAFLSGYRSRL